MRLIRARKAVGLTQEQLADVVHVERSTVQRWESGETAPQPFLQPKLGKVLGLAPNQLAELLAEPARPDASTVTLPAPSIVGHDQRDPAADSAWQELVRGSGELVELDLGIMLDVGEDGWARLTYRRELFNLGDRPISRLSCELWFEHTQGPLKITPVNEGDRRIAITRTHDTPNMAAFACLISPPVQPGESGIVSYACEGCRFVYDHYWRQQVARHTRDFSFRLRHKAAHLVSCTATEEHADGAENSASEALQWDEHDGEVDITLTRHYLRPNQAVTLRWEVSHDRS